VKPSNSGSSIGITKAHHRAELLRAIDVAAQFDRKILVEQGFPTHAKLNAEYWGMIPRLHRYWWNCLFQWILRLRRKVCGWKIRSRHSGKAAGSCCENNPAVCTACFSRAGLCGDGTSWFSGDKKSNRIYLNEINTIPGLLPSVCTQNSGGLGMPFAALLDTLVQLALERTKRRQYWRRPTSLKKTGINKHGFDGRSIYRTPAWTIPKKIAKGAAKNKKRTILLVIAFLLFLYLLLDNKGILTRFRLEAQHREWIEKVKSDSVETIRLQEQIKALEAIRRPWKNRPRKIWYGTRRWNCLSSEKRKWFQYATINWTYETMKQSPNKISQR